MKPSEVCKSAGLKSLAELSEFSGESVQTLNNWYKSEPRRFELVLKGVMFERTIKSLELATRLAPRKVCTMNCSVLMGDTRAREEIKENCSDCIIE